MLKVEFVGDRALLARLARMPDRMKQMLRRTVTTLALKLEARVKFKLSGDVLHVRTGALRRSISHTVDEVAGGIVGRVFSSGDVKYAAIHEFGGQTPAHIIVPNQAKALAFMVGGELRFAARVNHPGSKIPERSYMRSSLKEMSGEIKRDMQAAVVRGAQEK
jgi:phage gpG-like protein